MHLKLFQGSTQNDSCSQQLHQIISEDGEPLIVAADTYVGDDSVEALEAQVCAHIFDNVTAYFHTTFTYRNC
jgi:predicted RNase H-like nuclease (RuvC/YqgF family)